METGPLSFVYWPGQKRAAEALRAAMSPLPRMPGLPRDVLADRPITVYLPPDEATFDSLAPGAPDWSGAVALPEHGIVVLPTYGPRAGGLPLRTVLHHELAHIALDRYLRTSVPRWFHEGYAQLAAGSWGAEEAWTLRVAILLGRLPALESLRLEFAGRRAGAAHAYLLAYTAVEYLHRLGGRDGFARLLAAWRETGDLDTALRRTYGLTLSQFERLWQKDVSRRFGWLLVAAQATVYWTALTILLLAMGYWKKRRVKRKLETLQAASREAEAGPDEPWRAGGGELDDRWRAD
jgi:hypothetical protein